MQLPEGNTNHAHVSTRPRLDREPLYRVVSVFAVGEEEVKLCFRFAPSSHVLHGKCIPMTREGLRHLWVKVAAKKAARAGRAR